MMVFEYSKTQTYLCGLFKWNLMNYHQQRENWKKMWSTMDFGLHKKTVMWSYLKQLQQELYRLEDDVQIEEKSGQSFAMNATLMNCVCDLPASSMVVLGVGFAFNLVRRSRTQHRKVAMFIFILLKKTIQRVLLKL